MNSADKPLQVVSRLHMSEQQEEDKKNYEAKERLAALRKSKEKKLADLKVSCDLYSNYYIYSSYLRYEQQKLSTLKGLYHCI